MGIVMGLVGLAFFGFAIFIGRHIVSDIQLQIVVTCIAGGFACLGLGYAIAVGESVLSKLRRWERAAKREREQA